MPKKTTPTVIKEESMEIQKKMIAVNFRQLYDAPKSGKKVVSTFVPGKLKLKLIKLIDWQN